MNYYTQNLESITKSNNNYRQVLYTGKYSQLVVMSLNVGEEIGEEVHDDVDQFFRVESGQATFKIEDVPIVVDPDHVMFVSAGTKHNVVSTGETDLKLYTIYSPPNHPDGTVDRLKSEEHH